MTDVTDRTANDKRALQSVGLQFLVNGLVWASFAPRLTELRDGIGVNIRTMGLVLASASIGGLLGSAVCGRLITKFGTKAVVIAGGIGLIGTLPFVGFAQSAFGLAIALSVLHFMDVVSDVAMNIQGSRISARRKVPIMNRLHGLWSLGTVVGGLASVFLARQGVSVSDQLIGAPILFAVVLVFVGPGLLSVDEPPAPARENSGRTASGGTASGGTASRRRVALMLGGLGILAMTVELIPSDWASFRLRDDLGATADVAAWGFVAFTTGMLIGRFAGDFVQAKVGDRALQGGSPVLAIVGIAIAALVDSTSASLAGFVIAGLGVSVLFPYIYDLGAKAAEGGGAALGAMTAGSRVAAFGAPAMVGGLAGTSALGVGAAIATVTIPAAIAVIFLSRQVAS